MATAMAELPKSAGARKDPPQFLDADASDPLSIVLTVGPFTYSPVKYNTFTAGPVSATVWRAEGETSEDLYARASKLVNWMYDREFEAALQRYMLEIRRGDLVTRGNAGASR